MLDRYINMTKSYLIKELGNRQLGSINLERNLEIENKILKNYIEFKKEIDNIGYSSKKRNQLHLQYKAMIEQKERDIGTIKEYIIDNNIHIKAIQNNLSTYDYRYHIKFGRKSPRVEIDFGYNIRLTQ